MLGCYLFVVFTTDIYDDIRSKPIDKGVPESDIAFIHDAGSDVKKKDKRTCIV